MQREKMDTSDTTPRNFSNLDTDRNICDSFGTDKNVYATLPPTARERIVSHIVTVFQKAKTNRENNGIDRDFINALYQVRGEYSPEQMAQVKAEGVPDVFVPLILTAKHAKHAKSF